MARSFTLRDWRDAPEETTPIDRETLRDAESRLSLYSFEVEAHWRAPVAKLAERSTKGTVELNDIIYVEETNSLYVWNGAAWITLTVELAAEQVTEANLKNEAVATTKIKNEAVTAAKLATDAVIAAKIKAEAVTTAKIASEAVTEEKIANEAVTGKKVKVGVAEALKELKENTSIEPSSTASTTVYLSLVLKNEATEFEVIADGKPVYKFRKATPPAGQDVNFMIRLKAGAKFEVKLNEGKIETSTTTKSVYTVQEG